MEKLYDLYERYRDYILFFVLLVLMMLSSAFIFWYFSNDISNVKESLKERKNFISNEEVVNKEIFVNIKGEVKKPGVYSLEEGKRVIDVVKKAGGFTKDADSSVNNLSKKLVDEMVIIIYSKDEVSDYLSVREKEEVSYGICKSELIVNDSCVDSVNGDDSTSDSTISSDSSISNKNQSVSSSSDKVVDNSSSKLISINTATKEELMSLPSIGDAKAEAIIEYRKTQKFNYIEDIKNVSGIGDALFEKIKDYITT